MGLGASIVGFLKSTVLWLLSLGDEIGDFFNAVGSHFTAGFKDWAGDFGEGVADVVTPITTSITGVGAAFILQGFAHQIHELLPADQIKSPILRKHWQEFLDATDGKAEEWAKKYPTGTYYSDTAFQEVMHQLNEILRNFWKTLQVSAYDALTGLLTPYPGLTFEDGKANAVQYLEIVLGLNAISAAISAAIEALSLGQLEVVAESFHDLYYNLGFCWLTWVVWSEPFRQKISTPLRKGYQREMRPEEPTKAELIRYLTTRRIEPKEFMEEMAKLGYNDYYSSWYRFWEYKDLTLANLRRLKALGVTNIDYEAYVKHLGYSDSDVPHVLKLLEPVKGEEEAKEISVAVAGRLFSRGKRDEPWFRDFLSKRLYTEDMIEAMIDYYRADDLEEERGLLSSEVSRALKAGEITESQAREYWKQLGRTDDAINVLVALALHQKEVEQKDATVSTYDQLFVAGRIPESQYRSKLQELGISPEGIEAYVERAKLKMIEEPKLLTESQVLSAFKNRVKDESWAREYLARLKRSPDDIDVLIELNKPEVPTEEKKREVSRSVWDSLFNKGAITESKYREELLKLGYSLEAVDAYVLRYSPTVPAEAAPVVKELTRAEILEVWREGFQTSSWTRSRLRALNIASADIELLLKTNMPKITVDQAIEMYRTRLIEFDVALEHLLRNEVPEADARARLEAVVRV